LSITYKERTYHCPQCNTEVPFGASTCVKGHQLDWAYQTNRTAATAQTPTEGETTKFNNLVFWLYIVIFAFLGFALLYTIYTNNTTIPGSIITAMVTIAGFAVGINVDKSSK
jgi:hypothetical protein